MVTYSALVRSHQSTSADSFGLVRPAWIEYTRSAVPQNVEVWPFRRWCLSVCSHPAVTSVPLPVLLGSEQPVLVRPAPATAPVPIGSALMVRVASRHASCARVCMPPNCHSSVSLSPRSVCALAVHPTHNHAARWTQHDLSPSGSFHHQL